MKLMTYICVVFFVLLPLNTGAFAQRPHSSCDMGAKTTSGKKKECLRPEHLNCGRMRLAQANTNMSAEDLVHLYQTSEAKNFGQFVCAILVSKRLNLDVNQVLTGLRRRSLADTVKNMGVAWEETRAAIRAAIAEIVEAQQEKTVGAVP